MSRPYAFVVGVAVGAALARWLIHRAVDRAIYDDARNGIEWDVRDLIDEVRRSSEGWRAIPARYVPDN